MKRWLTVPRIGSGTEAAPYRPDLPPGPVVGFVLGASDHAECLIKVLWLGSATTLRLAVDARLSRYHGDTPSRTALLAEARRLGAGADWSPDGYDVGEGSE